MIDTFPLGVQRDSRFSSDGTFMDGAGIPASLMDIRAWRGV